MMDEIVKESTMNGFMTIKEAADEMGISRSRCYQMARRGELPVLKLGGVIRVPKIAYEQWQRDQSMKALATVTGGSSNA
jgi:excisionase family DNA binding protein